MEDKTEEENKSLSLDSIIFSSPIRLLIMILLINNNSIIMKDLLKMVNTSSGNLDHHIKQLEEANYIQRFPTKANQRLLYSVALTQKGKNVITSQMGNLKKIMDNYKI